MVDRVGDVVRFVTRDASILFVGCKSIQYCNHIYPVVEISGG